MPVDLARLLPKLDRSRYHLEWIAKATEAWRTTSTRLESREHPVLLQVDWWLEVTSPPPIEISVVAGEVAHALRSSLDNVVWQIYATQGGDISTTPTALKWPLADEAAKWDAAAAKASPFATADQLEVMRSVQPFSDPAAAGLLHELRGLNNADKHDVLQLMWWQHTAATYRQRFEDLALLPADAIDDLVADAPPKTEVGWHPVVTRIVRHVSSPNIRLRRDAVPGYRLDPPSEPELHLAVGHTRAALTLPRLWEIHDLVSRLVHDLAALG